MNRINYNDTHFHLDEDGDGGVDFIGGHRELYLVCIHYSGLLLYNGMRYDESLCRSQKDRLIITGVDDV